MENFIHEQYLDDLTICDELIEYFNRSEKKPGTFYGGTVDTEVKDSTDAILYDGILADKYLKSLQVVLNSYMDKFPYSKEYCSWGIIEPLSLQHYAPEQGYKSWHCERTNCDFPVVSRHLVFMTYLNDVTDGGGTEFYHQKIITKARKGLTVIWPSDWTYTHRGEISPTQDKYIITGWFNYLNNKEK